MNYDWLWYGLLATILVLGILSNIFGIPGLWLMIGATGLYGWITHWQYVGLWTLLALVGVAVIAEIVEFIAGGAGARRAGGSRRATWWSLIGGIVGALFLTIPIPIVGTIIGACLGAFLGALIAEYTVHGHANKSLAVGLGAAEGKLIGIGSKLAFGLIMLIIALWVAAPLPSRQKRPLPATTPVALEAQSSPAASTAAPRK